MPKLEFSNKVEVIAEGASQQKKPPSDIRSVD
jgi:hypothetical protein